MSFPDPIALPYATPVPLARILSDKPGTVAYRGHDGFGQTMLVEIQQTSSKVRRRHYIRYTLTHAPVTGQPTTQNIYTVILDGPLNSTYGNVVHDEFAGFRDWFSAANVDKLVNGEA